LLNREMNSGGLVVTVESNEVERALNNTRMKPDQVTVSTWSLSLGNILMVIGGVVAVSAVSVGLNFALRSWFRNGKEHRAEQDMEAVAAPELGPAIAGQLELGYIENTEHCDFGPK